MQSAHNTSKMYLENGQFVSGVTDQPWTYFLSLVWAALIGIFTAQGSRAGIAK